MLKQYKLSFKDMYDPPDVDGACEALFVVGEVVDVTRHQQRQLFGIHCTHSVCKQTMLDWRSSSAVVNPISAGFILRNINIHLHFVSFSKFIMAQETEIHPHGECGFLYPAYSIQ